MKNENENAELDFYARYLRVHLSEHHFERCNNQKFIEERADRALDTYTEAFMGGRPPHICQEMAMRTLLDGLYVSRYDVVAHILEEDCWRRLPSGAWEVVALHMITLPKIKKVLDRHEVNGDFLDREKYPRLRYELLGAMTEILDGYGL